GRQAPYTRRDQLHQVPRRIMKVERLSTSGPLDFLLNDDVVPREALTPVVEIGSGDAKGEMARSFRSVCWQLAAFHRGRGNDELRDCFSWDREASFDTCEITLAVLDGYRQSGPRDRGEWFRQFPLPDSWRRGLEPGSQVGTSCVPIDSEIGDDL